MSELLTILLDINSYFWAKTKHLDPNNQAAISDIGISSEELFSNFFLAINTFLSLDYQNRVAIYLYDHEIKELIFPITSTDEVLITKMAFSELKRVILIRIQERIRDTPFEINSLSKISPALYKSLCYINRVTNSGANGVKVR
eukprot:TRINITY_DN7335_c0_g1_i5.p2 TRINITY_DN7335_c0_g1~~TRINITY_DN7335_c0_g1_i5.p2  ORF type:complete len:143 (-),score=17.69 TRINITY_DN7335_c0_g1_i5:814-1242(-)